MDTGSGLHIEDVVNQRDAGHLLQGAHVSSVDPDGVDLDARGPSRSRDLLHLVLGSPVCDDDGHLGDFPGAKPGSRLLCEGFVHRGLYGEARHGAGRQGLDSGDGFLHVGFVVVAFEEELNLDRAGVVDHSHPGGVGADVQRVDHVSQEYLHLLKLTGTHAARAVDDKHQVQRTAPALRVHLW
ncbi:hypothetical protein EYF80_044584 [Liparis tanakae]|uniref:Uncharacterized protein n=1 Tax=Liparis tanakae TaxID=230148 RepID=A0A4Z2FVH5_9TELE|nr:hypothetical protein EYF80_044584 [Liparis tanakae]